MPAQTATTTIITTIIHRAPWHAALLCLLVCLLVLLRVYAVHVFQWITILAALTVALRLESVTCHLLLLMTVVIISMNRQSTVVTLHLLSISWLAALAAVQLIILQTGNTCHCMIATNNIGAGQINENVYIEQCCTNTWTAAAPFYTALA